MKHQLLFLTIFWGLLCSCSQNSKKANSITLNPTIYDSVRTIITPVAERYSTVERGHFDGREYTVVVRSIYLLTDSLQYDSSYYCQGNYLYLIDKANRTLDSIEISEGSIYGDEVFIQDVTQQLHFKSPIFKISSPAGSDTYINEFIEYKSGSLNKLFEVLDYKSFALEWKDNHTLTGFITGRDELVFNFQNYPITVSLDDYSMKIQRPEKQEIKYSTMVLSNFKGYRIADNNEQIKYLVKKGTPVLIDSINRATSIVRVVIDDSIVVYVPFSSIKNKVQSNTDG